MYVEMYGDNTQQKNNLPSTVHLRVRHESASYFKDGNNVIRKFRQKLGTTSWQKFQFNRFGITDQAKCDEEISKDNSKYSGLVRQRGNDLKYTRNIKGRI